MTGAYKDRSRDGMGRIGAEEREVCFPAPKGAGLDGSDGEAMIRWKRRDDGQIEIVSVNGKSLGGGGDEESGAQEDEEGGTDDQIMASEGAG